jgi:hypothetical protein
MNIRRVIVVAFGLMVVGAIFVTGYYTGFHDGIAWRQWDRVQGNPPKMWLYPADPDSASPWQALAVDSIQRIDAGLDK